jgi:hypothetical protein
VGQDVSAEFCLPQIERIVAALPAGRRHVNAAPGRPVKVP